MTLSNGRRNWALPMSLSLMMILVFRAAAARIGRLRRLLTAVCEGRAGAVFALEASRLARNNRDWHHLIDLCVLTDTLVIDGDGIYDPRQINDRLLL